MAVMEGAEGFGWIVSITVTLITTALAVGANNARNKRTALDVAELKRDHAGQIDESRKESAAQVSEIRARTEALNVAFNAYQLQVEREYPRKVDLTAMEQRLIQKVEEIKVDVSKRGLEHTIKGAVAAAMAGHILAAKGKGPE